VHTGTPIEALEGRFAELYGAPGAVATGFGRGAIYLALAAIGVRGRRVLLPDLICRQVVRAVERAGGIPAYFPVPLDLAVRPEEFRAALPADAAVAILVHYFGMPQSEIAALVAICRERQIPTIEDCALALLTPAPGGLCGTFGDFATFSFTKSDWCYGGGMVVGREATTVDKMRRIRDEQFAGDDAFCERYGRLSEIDYAANRPSLAQAMALKGHNLQALFAAEDQRFATENFFDAAPEHLRMSQQAAIRAWQIVDGQDAVAARRQVILAQLETGRKVIGAGNGFLVLDLGGSRARGWAETAAARGITLRQVWSAYQTEVPQTQHAERVLVLEFHPELEPAEIATITNWLAGG